MHASSVEAVWEQTTLVRKVDPKNINHYEKDFKINLNTADKKLLEQLHSIGPKKAQAIIEYRQEKGPLRSVKDLLNIKGFSKKIVENILAKNSKRLCVE